MNKADIIYLQADGYATKVYCVGRIPGVPIEMYSCGYNLGKYEGYLPDVFFRSHRSYWINMTFFRCLAKNAVELSVNELKPLPVSRGNWSKLLQWLEK